MATSWISLPLAPGFSSLELKKVSRTGQRCKLELLRSIITRLRGAVGDRRRARRYRARIRASVSLLDVKLVAESAIPRQLPQVEGYTRDLSETGLALVVPTIRIGEYYLTGDGRRLRITLDLPEGPLALHVIPVRYEKLDEDKAETGYLIGVRITEVSDADRTQFNAYLEKLGMKDEG